MPEDRNTAFILGLFSNLLGHPGHRYLSFQRLKLTIQKRDYLYELPVVWQPKKIGNVEEERNRKFKYNPVFGLQYFRNRTTVHTCR